MARLASQARGGYYPAPFMAVDAVLERLRPPTGGACTILDPCAGEGAALARFAVALGATPWAVELDEGRADALRSQFPSLDERCILAPADFLRCHISRETFSFVWCNPPYDFATGGMGRTEYGFLDRAADVLVPGGVLALACPEDVASSYRTLCWFNMHFDFLSALHYPEGCREYKETVLLGRKRKQINPYGHLYLGDLLAKQVVYDLPAGRRPLAFRKAEPTDRELIAMLRNSPLRHRFARLKVLAPIRPPMVPGDGHRALLLACGYCNGLIRPEGEPPHVVRGTVRKSEYLASQDETKNQDGSVTTKTVYSEKIDLMIRCATLDGEIVTLLQE